MNCCIMHGQYEETCSKYVEKFEKDYEKDGPSTVIWKNCLKHDKIYGDKCSECEWEKTKFQRKEIGEQLIDLNEDSENEESTIRINIEEDNDKTIVVELEELQYKKDDDIIEQARRNHNEKETPIDRLI